MRRTAFQAVAARVLALPEGSPLPFGLLLRALRCRAGDRAVQEGGVPSRLRCWPIVRRGDVIEVDLTGVAKPFAGCMVAVAYDAGDDERPYPCVEAAIVFDGPGGLLWCDTFGNARPLAKVRVLGVVTRHQTRLPGGSRGSFRMKMRREGLPFFYTREVYESTLASHDPEGLRL